jgi:hypothetical protein
VETASNQVTSTEIAQSQKDRHFALIAKKRDIGKVPAQSQSSQWFASIVNRRVITRMIVPMTRSKESQEKSDHL